jgi:hypothetical protein
MNAAQNFTRSKVLTQGLPFSVRRMQFVEAAILRPGSE